MKNENQGSPQSWKFVVLLLAELLLGGELALSCYNHQDVSPVFNTVLAAVVRASQEAKQSTPPENKTKEK